MGRNKYVYGLADWALVVIATADKGGTWAGAVEALKSGKTRVFVRVHEPVPEGNRKLLEKGALPFPDEPWIALADKLSRAEVSLPVDGLVRKSMLQEARSPY